MSGETVPLLAFSANGQHFMLDVMRVRGLLRSMPLVPSPGAQPWLMGHMVLRGEVLPVLSLQLALTEGLRMAAATVAPGRHPNHILVLDVSGHSMALMVDRVNEVLRVPKEALRPDLGPQALRSPVSFGICEVRGVAHVLLDVRPLLAMLADGSFTTGDQA